MKQCLQALKFYFSFLILSASFIPASAQNSLWLKAFSGSANQSAQAVCVNEQGLTFVSGNFSAEVAVDGNRLTGSGGTDFFVTVLNSGGEVISHRKFGDSGTDFIFGSDCDATDFVYVTGGFSNELIMDEVRLTSSGGTDYFTAKFDTEGRCVWAVTGEGSASDFGTQLTVSPLGNVFSLGLTEGDLNIQGIEHTHLNGQEIFLNKYDSEGSLLWSTFLFGDGNAYGHAITADNRDDVILCGSFDGQLFFNGREQQSVGGDDIFIAKYDVNGRLLWNKQFGNTENEIAQSIGTDGEGNIYMAGSFQGRISFDAFTLESREESRDLFMVKLTSEGDVIQALNLGGSGDENEISLSVSPSGEVLFSGTFSGDFEYASERYSAEGGTDIFIAAADADGKELWIRQFQGTGNEGSPSLAYSENASRLVLTGTFDGNFSDSLFTLPSASAEDAFLWAAQYPGPSFGVALSSFEVNCSNGNPTLNWVSDTESGLALYTIERKNSGASDFETISEVLPEGEGTRYFYTDTEAPEGRNTYRLRMTGFADEQELSKEVSTDCSSSPTALPEEKTAALGLRLYPNPSKNYVVIESDFLISEVSIYSTDGKLLKKEAVYAEKATLDLSQLKQGVYILRTAEGGALRLLR